MTSGFVSSARAWAIASMGCLLHFLEGLWFVNVLGRKVPNSAPAGAGGSSE